MTTKHLLPESGPKGLTRWPQSMGPEQCRFADALLVLAKLLEKEGKDGNKRGAPR